MIYIKIDRDSENPLVSQIYDFIKEAVLKGTIKPGEKLPSSRELSKNLNVARNVIIESYEQLAAEGYVCPRGGSGTYISQGVQFQRNVPIPKGKGREENPRKKDSSICFRTGIPDLEAIPVKQWGQFYHKIALDIKPSQMDYQDSFGDCRLRNQLSLYLNRARGACISAERILITNGAAQSFSLLCGLVSSGEYALVENPLSHGILHTLESGGVDTRTIQLDASGMITSQLPKESPKLIFTTPSHQFPSGVVLPAGRRIEIIRYAQMHNAYVVEDDYDSEFRFDGSPIQSMQYLDPERVIYVGTFSKTLMPALRIGYMVLPHALLEQMREAKFAADMHSSVLEQLALAKFMEEGHFEHHIRKMRKLYLKKRNCLIACLKRTFGDRVKISGAEAGLHLVAAFEGICFDASLMKKIEDAGIDIAPVNKHYRSEETHTPYDDSLIFGYGNTKFQEIEEGIRRLSFILEQANGSYAFGKRYPGTGSE